jgi:hypothetical protein
MRRWLSDSGDGIYRLIIHNSVARYERVSICERATICERARYKCWHSMRFQQTIGPQPQVMCTNATINLNHS